MNDDGDYGGWIKGEFIGRGGNGQVWKATNGDVIAALKVLNATKAHAEPFRRFRHEVDVLRRLADEPGIVPILDASLPEQPSRRKPAWLVMPLAVPIRIALGERPQIETVVEAIASIADTLARLAEQEICHRDVKPENLYRLGGRWVIGDFGLVDFPEKDDITETGRAIGPRFYIAPEMLRDPNASGFPADVLSLLKTLWVLATGQHYPPQGSLSATDLNESLATWINHPRVHLLDSLIERGTSKEPSNRPTMRDVANDLRTWLSLANEPVPPTDVSDIAHKLKMAARPFQESESNIDRSQKQAGALLDRSMTELQPIADVFAATGLPHSGPNKGYGPILSDSGLPKAAFGDYGGGVSLTLPGPIKHEFETGFMIQVLDATKHRIWAGHTIRPHKADKPLQLHSQTIDVEAGSIKEEAAFKMALQGLFDNLRRCLEQFTAFVNEQQTINPPSP